MLFDMKKLENFMGGIKDHLAEQKKQRELEILVNATAIICTSQGITVDNTEQRIEHSMNIARGIILKAKAAI